MELLQPPQRNTPLEARQLLAVLDPQVPKQQQQRQPRQPQPQQQQRPQLVTLELDPPAVAHLLPLPLVATQPVHQQRWPEGVASPMHRPLAYKY